MYKINRDSLLTYRSMGSAQKYIRVSEFRLHGTSNANRSEDERPYQSSPYGTTATTAPDGLVRIYRREYQDLQSNVIYYFLRARPCWYDTDSNLNL